jgi:hypothetical protein
MVPIVEALRLLSRHFDEDILRLFRHVQTASFFRFNGQFYEQTGGVAMGLGMHFRDSPVTNKSTVSRPVKRFRDTGSVQDRNRSGRPSVFSDDTERGGNFQHLI